MRLGLAIVAGERRDLIRLLYFVLFLSVRSIIFKLNFFVHLFLFNVLPKSL